MQSTSCDIIDVQQLTDFIYKIQLKPSERIQFKPGQYLEVVLADDDKRPFSVASSPDKPYLELHIGASSDAPYAMEVVKYCQNNTSVNVNVGLGTAHWQTDNDRPVILLAGGTGFSYIKSIADHLRETEHSGETLIFWGGKTIDNLYAFSELSSWANEQNAIEFIPVVENPPVDWHGKTGYVHQAVLEQISDLSQYDIYIAGPFNMVKVVRDDFLEAGAIRDHMFADAFAFI